MSAGRGTDALPDVGRHLASRTGRLLVNGWAILQTAVAAGLAYFLAALVLGNEQPFFAPVAAVVTLGLAFGERGRRALEVALGVVVGLAVADVIVRLIGVGVTSDPRLLGRRGRRSAPFVHPHSLGRRHGTVRRDVGSYARGGRGGARRGSPWR